MTTRVLIAGATGALGNEVVAEAKRRGLWVRAIGRDAAKLASLGADETMKVDVLSASLDDVVADVDVVFSCLGASVAPSIGGGRKSYEAVDTPANVKLFEAAKAAGAKKLVYVSVAKERELGHLRYVRAHEAVVDWLKTSGVEHAIVRPTGFFSAFDAVFDLAAKGPVPLLGDPEARTNPIHDADLATVCVTAMLEPYDAASVGGPEILTRRQISTLAFEALGKKAKFRRVPSAFIRLVSVLLRPFLPRVADITRFFLEVSSRDCIGEARGKRLLGAHFEARARAR